MGFKTSNYDVVDMGITIPQAYARISEITVDMKGQCKARFDIQQKREDVGIKKSFGTKHFFCSVDKDKPIHQQVYEKAKVDIFKDWEDDIVETVAKNE